VREQHKYSEKGDSIPTYLIIREHVPVLRDDVRVWLIGAKTSPENGAGEWMGELHVKVGQWPYR
jgi:hypothetical protein